MRAASVSGGQIGGAAEEIAAGSDFAVARSIGAKKADVALLHEVVGECGVGGDAHEIGPEGTGGALVEACEGFTLHGKAGGVGGGVACQHVRYCRFPGHGPVLPRRWTHCYGSLPVLEC